MRCSLFTLFILACGVVSAQQANPAFAERDPRYRLQANDVIEIQYRYTPEYNQTVSIQPDGFVTLQLLGDVKVGGLAIDKAHDVLLTRAATRLHDPEVVLLVKEFDKAHFVVLGEVNTPGRFDLRGDTTVMEAIAIAGGFKSASAKHSQVLLVRRVNDQFGETHVMNLKEMAKNRSFAEDRLIRPGDMVVIPQNNISKIERFVKWANVGLYANP
jgi:polysaccharide export outer membrane protein